MRKLWKRIVLTIFLLGVAFVCFYYPESVEMTETISSNPVVEKKTNNDGIIKLAHYLGLFCLVLGVWMWRDFLSITSIGFIGGSDLRPADPKSINNSFIKDSVSQDTEKFIRPDFESHIVQERKNAIIQNMRESYTSVTRVSSLSSKLNLPKNIVEACLFELQVEGLVRKDIVPGTLIGNYSLSDSWINKAVDDFKRKLVKKKEKIVSDLRYIRTRKNREIDSIIETESIDYIIEIKSISRYLDSSVIERGIKQLLVIEEEYKSQKPVQLILLLVLHKDFDLNIDAQLEEFVDVKDNLSIATYRLS